LRASTAPVSPLTVIARRLGALSLADLWWRYLALGGNHPRAALAEYLDGTAWWSAHEHNVLAQVLNESLWDLDCPSLAPFRRSGREPCGVAAEVEQGLRDTP
jgi:hypothetical protein